MMATFKQIADCFGWVSSVERFRDEYEYTFQGQVMLARKRHREFRIRFDRQALLETVIVATNLKERSLVSYETKDDWAVYFGMAVRQHKLRGLGDTFDLSLLGGEWKGEAMILGVDTVNRNESGVGLHIYAKPGCYIPTMGTIGEYEIS